MNDENAAVDAIRDQLKKEAAQRRRAVDDVVEILEKLPSDGHRRRVIRAVAEILGIPADKVCP